MSYSADTFVADEQPTTAKWNKLWSNDASFNDGTGIGDSTIDSRHYVDNSIDAEHLATNTIFLGRDEVTSNQTTSNTTVTQISGLSLTVTIPSGGRSVMVMMGGSNMYYGAYAAGSHYIQASLWSGTVGSGTQLGRAQMNGANSNAQSPFTIVAVHTPSAGSITYNGGFHAGAAGDQIGLEGSSAFPIWLQAMVI